MVTLEVEVRVRRRYNGTVRPSTVLLVALFFSCMQRPVECAWVPLVGEEVSGLGVTALVTHGTSLYVAYSDHQVQSVQLSSGVLTHVAGSGTAGFADGVGSAASFDSPVGLAVDGQMQTLFVSDNHCLRRIHLASRVVETLAGQCSPGSAGSVDGVGTAARFNSPAGLAVDHAGSRLVVCDTGNHRLRVVSLSDGNVRTLAGSIAGYADGHSAAALFHSPSSIAILRDVTSFANFLVVVADTGNGRLRTVDFNRETVTDLYVPQLTTAQPPLCIFAYSSSRKMAVLQAAEGWHSYNLSSSNTHNTRILLLDADAVARTAQVDTGAEIPHFADVDTAAGTQIAIAGGQSKGGDFTLFAAQSNRNVIISWMFNVQLPQQPTCTSGHTCGCNMGGNCSCGQYYKELFCWQCLKNSYCDCSSACQEKVGLPKPCPEGTHNPDVGAHSPEACRECPSGHICESGSDPEVCKAGHYCPSATISECPIEAFPCQIPCPVGTSGAPDRVGRAAENEGCTPCEAGFFAASRGSLECVACLPGTYTARTGSSMCWTCPAGFFCGAQSIVPQPCPPNTYSDQKKANNSQACIPCKNGLLSRAASPSAHFCNVTQPTKTTQPTTSTTTPVAPTSKGAIVETPAPIVMKPKLVVVQVQAELGGIAGHDAFLQCCYQYFVDVLVDMIQIESLQIHIYEICDKRIGCTTSFGSRRLLQTADVLVKFEIQTLDEISLITALLDEDFSYIFSARLARKVGNPTITVNLQLVDQTLAVGPPIREDELTKSVPPSTQSSSLFSTIAITLAAAIFVCCNCLWFRKRLTRCCIGNKKNPSTHNDDTTEVDALDSLDVCATGSSAQGRPTILPSCAGGYTSQITPRSEAGLYSSGNSQNCDQSSDASSQASPQPPTHTPLLLVVRPPTNIMAGAAKTSATAPDESCAPSSLLVTPASKGTAAISVAAVCAQAESAPLPAIGLSVANIGARVSSALICGSLSVCAPVQPSAGNTLELSYLHEMQFGARSPDTTPSSEDEHHTATHCNTLQHAVTHCSEDEEERSEKQAVHGNVSLDCNGLFELAMSPTAIDAHSVGDMARQSALHIDDLVSLFDMVSLTNANGEAYIDAHGLYEILKSVRDSDQRAAVDVYVSLGVDNNSDLSLHQLQTAWQLCTCRAAALTYTHSANAHENADASDAWCAKQPAHLPSTSASTVIENEEADAMQNAEDMHDDEAAASKDAHSPELPRADSSWDSD